MDIVHHRSNNMLLAAPKDSPVPCRSVPATKLFDADVTTMTTFWKPTPQELEMLNANGCVMLWVYGDAHPMVWVEAADTPTEPLP